jgi:hypothetical protein
MSSRRVPRRPSPIERLVPEVLADREQRAWQAYYERRWARLAGLLFQITRDQFGLPIWQVPYAAYLATRAQAIFARRGSAGGSAEAYMRRFYRLVRRSSGGRYDPRRAAAAELRWWIVHRKRAEFPDTAALVDVLAQLYVELYGIGEAAARPPAHHRAEAMELSDRWVRDGLDPKSPLLRQVRDELLLSYRALRAALSP